METISALLAFCAWNSLVTDEFPTQRSVTWSFDVSFDLRLKKTGWVNSREAGHLRCYRAHYDVTVVSVGVNEANPKSIGGKNPIARTSQDNYSKTKQN